MNDWLKGLAVFVGLNLAIGAVVLLLDVTGHEPSGPDCIEWSMAGTCIAYDTP